MVAATRQYDVRRAGRGSTWSNSSCARRPGRAAARGGPGAGRVVRAVARPTGGPAAHRGSRVHHPMAMGLVRTPESRKGAPVTAPPVATRRIRLTYADTDAAQMLYFAAWFPWMVRVRVEWDLSSEFRFDRIR